MIFFFFSELIEELVRATDLKFCMRVEYILSRKKVLISNRNFHPSLRKGDKYLHLSELRV